MKPRKKRKTYIAYGFAWLVLCLISLVFVMIVHDDLSKNITCLYIDDKAANDIEMRVEQQMSFNEIAKVYAKRGKIYNLEKFFKEEGQWWKDVSWSCPPRNSFGFKTCEVVDTNKPFRIIYCKNNGECALQYFNLE